jgi:hypothetical protein
MEGYIGGAKDTRRNWAWPGPNGWHETCKMHQSSGAVDYKLRHGSFKPAIGGWSREKLEETAIGESLRHCTGPCRDTRPGYRCEIERGAIEKDGRDAIGNI